MKRFFIINDVRYEYQLEYKNVKNINLRIRHDGTIYVSANRWISITAIEEFIMSKSEFILTALEKCKQTLNIEPEKYFSEQEIRDVINEICKKEYPYYEKLGIVYPKIKFRKMVSRWGSCHVQKGILTFNTNLMYAPKECVRYVVLHEFTHFLQANHSVKFYEELEKVCPEWKKCRNRMKTINIR